MKIQVLPSLLACDFSRLGEEIDRAAAAGADAIHVDVMDGHFVPNITIGPVVVEKIRKCTSLPLDVHLMVQRPDVYAPRFVSAGANMVTFHIEAPGVSAPDQVIATLDGIRARGARAGLAIKPATSIATLFPFLGHCTVVLVMTVEPGFGGQQFMQAMLPKIAALRQEVVRRSAHVDIEVDGGIDAMTAPLCAAHGANAFVAGSFLFGHEDIAGRIAAMHALQIP